MAGLRQCRRPFQALLTSGAAVLQPPQDGPFGRQFQVRDPDGYLLTFHCGGAQ